jgi:hypothetical protein
MMTKILKGLRRAERNYIRALRRYEKESGQLVQSIEVNRFDRVSDNEFAVESELDYIKVKTDSRRAYLTDLREQRYESNSIAARRRENY